MLPASLIQSLQGTEGFDKEAFEQVHQSGEQVTSIRINPVKLPEEKDVFSLADTAAGGGANPYLPGISY